jgi:hypothetical protein
VQGYIDRYLKMYERLVKPVAKVIRHGHAAAEKNEHGNSRNGNLRPWASYIRLQKNINIEICEKLMTDNRVEEVNMY